MIKTPEIKWTEKLRFAAVGLADSWLKTVTFPLPQCTGKSLQCTKELQLSMTDSRNIHTRIYRLKCAPSREPSFVCVVVCWCAWVIKKLMTYDKRSYNWAQLPHRVWSSWRLVCDHGPSSAWCRAGCEGSRCEAASSTQRPGNHCCHSPPRSHNSEQGWGRQWPPWTQRWRGTWRKGHRHIMRNSVYILYF